MSGYFNISEVEREELENAFFALEDLLNQLKGVGIYIPDADSGQWHGTEGLSFSRAEHILRTAKGEATEGELGICEECEQEKVVFACAHPETGDGVKICDACYTKLNQETIERYKED